MQTLGLDAEEGEGLLLVVADVRRLHLNTGKAPLLRLAQEAVLPGVLVLQVARLDGALESNGARRITVGRRLTEQGALRPQRLL